MPIKPVTMRLTVPPALCLLLAVAPLSQALLLAEEEQDQGAAAMELATLCRLLVGPGHIAAIDVQGGEQGMTVALCDDAGKVHVIRGTGGRWRSQTTDLGTSQRPRLRLVDLDGDGEFELLVASKRLRIFSTTKGVKRLWTSAVEFDDISPPVVEVLDFDQDGRKEIVVLNYKRRERAANEPSIFIFRQDAALGIPLSVVTDMIFKDDHDYFSTAGMAIGDFAASGTPQIVVGNDNGFLWHVALEDDELKLAHRWKVPRGGAVGAGLAAGELDGQPGMELLVGTNGGDLFVYGFSEGIPKVRASATAGRLAYGVTAGDFDGDGNVEFGLTRGHAGYAGMTKRDVVAEVWHMKGRKLERTWSTPTLGTARTFVRDIDQDGRDEMIVHSLTDGEIAVVAPR